MSAVCSGGLPFFRRGTPGFIVTFLVMFLGDGI
jgi:hypothetical protein